MLHTCNLSATQRRLSAGMLIYTRGLLGKSTALCCWQLSSTTGNTGGEGSWCLSAVNRSIPPEFWFPARHTNGVNSVCEEYLLCLGCCLSFGIISPLLLSIPRQSVEKQTYKGKMFSCCCFSRILLFTWMPNKTEPPPNNPTDDPMTSSPSRNKRKLIPSWSDFWLTTSYS